MSDVRAHQSNEMTIMPAVTRARAIWQRAVQDVAVEIVDPAQFAEMRDAWTDLVGRADTPNVFMDPALLAIAADVDPTILHRAMLVWKWIGGRRQLIGAWSFAIGQARHSILPLPVLRAPAYEHCYLATPVIDRTCLDETIESMLDAIADDAELPNIVTLDMMSGEGPTYEALMRVLTRRGSGACEFTRMQRPRLASQLDGKTYLERALSGATRKKLRQHRRRLAEKGRLNAVIATQPGAVCRQLEEFLAMEAAGWKGRNGTALLSSTADAAFMRGAIGILADNGCAAIHTLYVDNKPASMQIVIRAGATAYTWKTAYDETLQDFSPGMLLFEDYTAALLADDSIACVDSCSFDDSGYMASWTERHAVADIWLDARRDDSPGFRAICAAQRGYLAARGLAKRGYHAWRRRRKAGRQ